MATERNVLYPHPTDEETEHQRQSYLKEWRKREKKDQYPKSTMQQAWLSDVPSRIADHKITKLDELLLWNYHADM